MILEKDFRETDIEITGNQEGSIDMSVDTDSVNHLMMILSSNLYQDPIGSIIREYTSNAIDANVDAGIDEPVLVRLKMDGSNWKFEVQDYGPGLDDKDFRTIISKYGKSTKRDKADQLGYFGLGCKSGFAYTNQFHYTCVKDGVERKYLLYKGETGFTIDLLTEEKTDKRSGVTVSIPVRNYDNNNFYAGIKTQLAYFDNVYFDIDHAKLGYAYQGENLNKMQIFREEDFQWSNITGYNELHITLGKVSYPINWTALGISKIPTPVALRFGLDSGLFPIPNRENLIWNDATKKIVKDKIMKVANWFVTKYNSTVKQMPHIVAAWDYIGNSDYIVRLENKDMYITALAKEASIKLQEVKVDNIKLKQPSFYKSKLDALVKDYRIVGEMRSGILKTSNIWSYHTWLFYKDRKSVLLDDAIVMKGAFRDFLRASGYHYFVKRVTAADFKKEDMEFYRQQLHLDKEPKAMWRSLINEFLDVRKSITDNLWTDGRNLQNSKEFQDFKEKNKKKVVSKSTSKALNKQVGQVTIGFLEPNAYGKYTFKRKAVDIKSLATIGKMMVLVDKIDADYGYIFSKHNVVFVQIGIKDLKKVEELKLKNFMTLKELRKTKAFARTATALLAAKLCEDYNKLNKNRMEIVQHCIQKYDALYRKVKAHAATAPWTGSLQAEEILQVAETNNLWDQEHIGYIRAFEKAIKDYDFIHLISGKPEDCENLINNIILFKKTRFEEKFPDLTVCKKEKV